MTVCLTILSFFTVRCAQSQACYFAERLHKAISGMGTRDRCLVRLIVSHCDSDLGNIKREYEKLYGRSLAADISVILIEIVSSFFLCFLILFLLSDLAERCIW